MSPGEARGKLVHARRYLEVTRWGLIERNDFATLCALDILMLARKHVAINTYFKHHHRCSRCKDYTYASLMARADKEKHDVQRSDDQQRQSTPA